MKAEHTAKLDVLIRTPTVSVHDIAIIALMTIAIVLEEGLSISIHANHVCCEHFVVDFDGSPLCNQLSETFVWVGHWKPSCKVCRNIYGGSAATDCSSLLLDLLDEVRRNVLMSHVLSPIL